MSQTTRRLLLVLIPLIACVVWLSNTFLSAVYTVPEDQPVAVATAIVAEADISVEPDSTAWKTVDVRMAPLVTESEPEGHVSEVLNTVRITEAKLQEIMAEIAESLAGSDNIEIVYCTAEIQDEVVRVQAIGSLMGMPAETDALAITFDGMNVYVGGPILIFSKYNTELTLWAEIYCNDGNPALNVTNFSMGSATIFLKMMGIDITKEKMSEVASGFMASSNSDILCQAESIFVENGDLYIYYQDYAGTEEYLVTGEVKLQGGERPEESYNLPLTLNLYDPGVVLCSGNILSEEPLYSFTAGDGLSITGTDGETQTVYFQATIPGGTYHMCLSNTYTLHNVICNYVIAQNGQHLNMETLLFGNANCDARVSGGDFAMLLNDYWEQNGDLAWNNGRCDFDGNGQVTGLDYSIMVSNYSASSPVICGE